MPTYDRNSTEYKALATLALFPENRIDDALAFYNELDLAVVLAVCNKVKASLFNDEENKRFLNVATLLAISGSHDALNRYLEENGEVLGMKDSPLPFNPADFLAYSGNSIFLHAFLEAYPAFLGDPQNEEWTLAHYFARCGNVEGLLNFLKKYPNFKQHALSLARMLANSNNPNSIHGTALFIYCTPEIDLSSFEAKEGLVNDKISVRDIISAVKCMRIPHLKATLMTDKNQWYTCLLELEELQKNSVPGAEQAYRDCQQFLLHSSREKLLAQADPETNKNNDEALLRTHLHELVPVAEMTVTTPFHQESEHLFYEKKADLLRKQALSNRVGALSRLLQLSERRVEGKIGLSRYYSKLAQIENQSKAKSTNPLIQKLQSAFAFENKNAALSFSLFSQTMKDDPKNSLYALAKCYEKGIGCEQSWEQALWHYFQSAMLGNARAVKQLARTWPTAENNHACIARIYLGILETGIDKALVHFRSASDIDHDFFLQTTFRFGHENNLTADQKKLLKKTLRIIAAEIQAAKVKATSSPVSVATVDTQDGAVSLSNTAAAADDDDNDRAGSDDSDDENFEWMNDITSRGKLTPQD